MPGGARGDGRSQPAFYDLVAGSLGLQIGGQVSEVVFTITSEKRSVSSERSAQVRRRHVDRGRADRRYRRRHHHQYAGRRLPFAKTAGLFGGVSFEGAGIIKKDDWNLAYYVRARPRADRDEGQFKNPNTQATANSLQPN